MKNIRLIFAALLLALIFCASTRAKDMARFNLTLDGMAPKVGIETEKIMSITQITSYTNDIKGQHSVVTNSTRTLDLRFKDKFLIWDKTNQCVKVEILINRFLSIEQAETNVIVKAGTKIAGTFVAGEWFFESSSGTLPSKATLALGKIYDIAPGTGNNELGTLIPNKPVSVGESWQVDPLPGLKQKLGEMGNSSAQ